MAGAVDPANVAKKILCNSDRRVPTSSRLHPIIPRFCVPAWKTDMKNRSIIMQNAHIGSVPHYEHDETLYLNKREQMSYNVEERSRVDNKTTMPPRAKLLRPQMHEPWFRHQSELMIRRDEDLVEMN